MSRYKGHFVTWLGAAIVIAGLNSSYAAQQPPTSKDPNVDRSVWDLSPAEIVIREVLSQCWDMQKAQSPSEWARKEDHRH